MPESEATKRMKIWEKRRTDWLPRILTGGISGLGGSVVSAISEIDKFPPAPSDFKLGTIVVIVGWCIATVIAILATWKICTLKYSKARDEHILESDPNKVQAIQ